MEITHLLLRLTIAFVTLLVLTRLMGRKEISQMTFFNFISAISIGTIGASLAIDSTLSIQNGLIALGGWSIFTIGLGILDIKSRKSRDVIEGEPIILIKKGKIMEGALRKARLDMDALNVLLRKKNVFSTFDVDYAIFETDGTLSVLKKDSKQSVTKSDMNLQKKMADVFPIATCVISDGKADDENLTKLQLDAKWLKSQLQSLQVHSIQDVFYAEVQTDGTLYVDLKEDLISD